MVLRIQCLDWYVGVKQDFVLLLFLDLLSLLLLLVRLVQRCVLTTT